jgi:hypothetical protein
MKGRRKRLALKKTTVRRLTAQQLSAAGGGASGPDCDRDEQAKASPPDAPKN